MGYDYKAEQPKLFTQDGIKVLLQVRDRTQMLLKSAGAFRELEALTGIGGDSWLLMACLDWLIEEGRIVRLARDCWSQYNVYAAPKVHNA